LLNLRHRWASASGNMPPSPGPCTITPHVLLQFPKSVLLSINAHSIVTNISVPMEIAFFVPIFHVTTQQFPLVGTQSLFSPGAGNLCYATVYFLAFFSIAVAKSLQTFICLLNFHWILFVNNLAFVQGYQQTQWMPLPETLPGCPPGLEYLTQLDQLLVHQQVELFEGKVFWKLI